MRRFPLTELLEATGLTEAACGRACSWSGKTLKKARDLGLTDRQADTAAIRLGKGPWEVWADWFELEDPNHQEDTGYNADAPGYYVAPIFDLTAVDEFWQAAIDLQAVLAAVDARLAASNAVTERRQLHGLSAQEVALLVTREREATPSSPQDTSGTVAA